jgi:hypothetical protein
LFDAEVGIDGGIPDSTREVLVFLVGDVFLGLRISVFLAEGKVHNVH